MKCKLIASVAMSAMMIGLSASAALAEGELNIFNWGNYTNPELIKKFEEQFKVKVTLTDYDSNDTALAKVRAGGHGYDIVVPSASFIPIWIGEGLLLETNPGGMENAKNLMDNWKSPEFDPGRKYTAPWQWGTTGVAVNTGAYSGDVNTSAIFMDPPKELEGKVNVVPEMADIMGLAIAYVGGEPCTADKTVLKKVRDALVAAKPKWLSMDYGTTEKLSSGDWVASVNWNGSTFRARLKNDKVKYGYPKEGFPIWADQVVVLKDAKNADNAKAFQNFIMEPENAALISAFARYANAIKGSAEFMPADMKDAPELNIPEDLVSAGYVSKTCSPEATELYTAIWTELTK